MLYIDFGDISFDH